MSKSTPFTDNNFPVGRIPDFIQVSAQDIAALFRAIDALRPLVENEGARAAVDDLELLVEQIAGL
ncbi:conserved hypothetical protein [Paraburkholderia tropica]